MQGGLIREVEGEALLFGGILDTCLSLYLRDDGLKQLLLLCYDECEGRQAAICNENAMSRV